MDDATARTVNENVWELERAVAGGKVEPALRQALLRAQAQQIAYIEEQLGVEREHRAQLRPSDRSTEGVLLVHGAEGSPAELGPLADFLSDGGYSVYSVRLAGHAQPRVRAEQVSWRACAEDLLTRYRLLATACTQVHVVGLSFGAALALQMDVNPRPASYILVAPAIFPKLHGWQRLLIASGLDRWSWVRRRLGWDPEWTEAMEAARAASHWRSQPLLALMADDDPRTDPSGLGWIKRRAKHEASRIVRVPRGGHHFHLGEGKRAVHDAVMEFLGSPGRSRGGRN